MIILPLSYRKKQDKKKRIREAVDLAVQIQDRGQQVFTLAGILAFTDKIEEQLKWRRQQRRYLEHADKFWDMMFQSVKDMKQREGVSCLFCFYFIEVSKAFQSLTHGNEENS